MLATWRKSSLHLLTAENSQDVLTLRERELDALQNFRDSVGALTMKSVKLRDSYSEAMVVADKAVKEGLPLPAEHLQAIRQVVKMVDMEIGKSRPALRSAAVTEKKDSSPVTVSVK